MDELDRASFDAFLLAIRVIYIAFDLDQPATEFEKPFELLREIADGRTTLSSPAEMAARFPALRDLMYDAASSVMEHDRETATRVLRGLSSTL
ncbi:MAG TPA: hypothetical protein VF021_02310 [Longimicrobiales bacterium]